MPQKIEIDGEEKTVYTEDEVKNLQAGHDANLSKKETLGKLQGELGIETGQPIEAVFEKIKEFKDAANPNWQEARKVIKSLTTALKDKGVEVDANGNVKANPQGVSAEDIQKIVAEAVEAKVGLTTRQQALANYSDEDKGKLEPILNKLMTLGGTLKENLDLAESKVFPDRIQNNTRRVYNNAQGGGAPSSGGDKSDDFASTGEGKSLGAQMGLTYAKKTN